MSLDICRECWRGKTPLLASPQGGVAASSRKFREATEADAAGVVFLFVHSRKTTPSARSEDASRYFLNSADTPPCGDARRGIRFPVTILTLRITPQPSRQPLTFDSAGPILNPARGRYIRHAAG